MQDKSEKASPVNTKNGFVRNTLQTSTRKIYRNRKKPERKTQREGPKKTRFFRPDLPIRPITGFFRKGFCFCLCRGGQHFPFHLIARYHNRAGRPTDIGSAISGSGATDGIAAFVFPLFPRILENRTVLGFRRSRYCPRA